MKAYHEIQPDALEAALANGLKRTSRSDKDDDPAIIQTDRFLDAHRPRALRSQGVSRNNNLYAYVRTDDMVINVTNGALVPVATFIAASSERVLELNINPERCFVSDLDIYDTLKSTLQNHRERLTLSRLAKSYWHKVVKLPGFDPFVIRRPEIMITYDIPPNDIHVVR